MNIKEALVFGATKLKQAGVSSPELEARILLMQAMNRSLEYLFAGYEKKVDEIQLKIFETFLNRRLQSEPIAYIIGIKEFYGREFFVNNKVLIPRGDTEILVEEVLKEIESLQDKSLRSRVSGCGNLKHNKLCTLFVVLHEIAASVLTYFPAMTIHTTMPTRNDRYTILELGTGSGCISISLLLENLNCEIIATDISDEAITVARRNAIKHNVNDRIKIINSNWFEEVNTKSKFDFIISNPPYIAKEEVAYMTQETINYEPHLALFADNKGYEAYEKIAMSAKNFLKPQGKIIIEIGFAQAKKVTDVFNQYGFKVKRICKDLAGHDRVLILS